MEPEASNPPPEEPVLVCISPATVSDRLVQIGRRLVAGHNDALTIVYVEAQGFASVSQAAQDYTAETVRAAEAPGTHVVTLSGPSVAAEVIRYAQEHRITKIIVGQPRPRPLLAFLRPSLADQILWRSRGLNLDIHVVSIPPRQPGKAGRRRVGIRPEWKQYLPGFVLVSVLTAFGFWAERLIGPTNLDLLYLLTVVVCAMRWGRGPAIVTALVGAVTFDYFFVPPRLSFAATDAEYILTLIGLLVVALVISTLATRVQERAAAAREREAYTAALYSLSRSLASATHLEQILQAVGRRIEETFARTALVFLPREGRLDRCFAGPGAPLQPTDEAAEWVYQHGRPAGPGTGAFPEAHALCLPLQTSGGILGVLALQGYDRKQWLDPERRRLLEAFASQAALAIEREKLEKEAQRAQLLRETDKLQKALLNSISHNLRSPLASITGVLSSLAEDPPVLDETARRDLLETAREEAGRLNRLVGNLLDLTRLEAGAMRVKRSPCDVQDVIGAALAQLGEATRKHFIRASVPADLPLVPVDFVLIAQVLVNLVDNAVKYSPAGSLISIEAQSASEEIEISIADRGTGILPADLERVFERFNRVGRPGAADGTGLGLSICKGFVEAHGGRIHAESRPGGGTVVRFTLPLRTPEIASNHASYDGARSAGAGRR